MNDFWIVLTKRIPTTYFTSLYVHAHYFTKIGNNMSTGIIPSQLINAAP